MCLGEVGRVEQVRPPSALVRVGDRSVEVSLLALDGALADGDWVLVHAGFALERLDPAEAADALALRETKLPAPPVALAGTGGPDPAVDRSRTETAP